MARQWHGLLEQLQSFGEPLMGSTFDESNEDPSMGRTERTHAERGSAKWLRPDLATSREGPTPRSGEVISID